MPPVTGSIDVSRERPLIWDSLAVEPWHTWSLENSVPFKSDKEGHGDGEEKFVKELCLLGRPAQLAGGYEESWDVVEVDGKRWEVKEISAKNIEVRPGKDGISDVKKLLRTINDIVEALNSAYSYVGSDSLYRTLFESEGVMVERDSRVISDALEKIGQGSVSKGLMYGGTHSNPVGLLQILRDLQSFVKKRQTRRGNIRFTFASHYDFMSSESADVCIEDYLHVLKSNDMEIPESVGTVNRFTTYLWDPRVKKFVIDPTLLENLWKKSSSVEGTFRNVYGLALVHATDGFVMLPVEEASKFLKFERISQGRSKFRLMRKTKKIIHDSSYDHGDLERS